MRSTIEILTAEVNRLRGLADRMEAFVTELGGHASRPCRPAICENPVILKPTIDREYADLTQADAIVKALADHGPQTSRELFHRLNTAGFNFKRVAYVTSILPRLSGKVSRRVDGKLDLVDRVTA
jgi:hypothetical protein